MSNIIQIWTDGSCNAKDRVGGWGAIVIIDDVDLEISGSAVDTTINRMEIMAVLRALKLVATASTIEIYTDSQYVKNGIEKRGWVDRGSSTLNYDLWVHMNKLINHHESVNPIWVRGHSGIYHNERADTLAGKARKKRLKKHEGK